MNIKAFMLDDQSSAVLYDPQDWFPRQLSQFKTGYQVYLLCHDYEEKDTQCLLFRINDYLTELLAGQADTWEELSSKLDQLNWRELAYKSEMLRPLPGIWLSDNQWLPHPYRLAHRAYLSLVMPEDLTRDQTCHIEAINHKTKLAMANAMSWDLPDLLISYSKYDLDQTLPIVNGQVCDYGQLADGQYYIRFGNLLLQNESYRQRQLGLLDFSKIGKISRYPAHTWNDPVWTGTGSTTVNNPRRPAHPLTEAQATPVYLEQPQQTTYQLTAKITLREDEPLDGQPLLVFLGQLWLADNQHFYYERHDRELLLTIQLDRTKFAWLCARNQLRTGQLFPYQYQGSALTDQWLAKLLRDPEAHYNYEEPVLTLASTYLLWLHQSSPLRELNVQPQVVASSAVFCAQLEAGCLIDDAEEILFAHSRRQPGYTELLTNIPVEYTVEDHTDIRQLTTPLSFDEHHLPAVLDDYEQYDDQVQHQATTIAHWRSWFITAAVPDLAKEDDTPDLPPEPEVPKIPVYLHWNRPLTPGVNLKQG